MNYNTGQSDKADSPSSPKPPSPPSKNNIDNEPSPDMRDKLLSNEMRAFRNRGFHDGYDEGKRATLQESFDTGYKKAFEQNFILSTLKGVASALKSSYSLKQQDDKYNDINHQRHHQNQRPNSANYSTRRTNINDSSARSPMIQTPSSDSTESTASSSPKSTSLLSTSSSTYSSPRSSPATTSPPKNKHHQHRHSAGLSSSSRLSAQKYHNNAISGRRSAASSSSNDNGTGSDYTSGRLSSISSGNVNSFSSNPVVNVNISNNHLSLLESMKFDGSRDIESLKNDLIRICRENRLEILAHYVSQIG